MLNHQQKMIIESHTSQRLETARDWFPQHRIQPVKVAFDLIGQSAGHYYPANNLIRYNSHIAAKYFEHFVQQTVTHEVSHHIVYQLTSKARTYAQAHGPEWKAVMRRFGVTPERCHNYDLSEIPSKRQRRFSYRCACMQHQLSATRHNRVQKGVSYYCKSCGGELLADPISPINTT